MQTRKRRDDLLPDDEMIRAAAEVAAKRRGQSLADWLRRAVLVRLAIEGVVIADYAGL
jgi:hypothetical protein